MYQSKFVSVILAAAGMSNRMGSSINKQFIPLGGKPVLAHTIETFDRLKYIDEIIVVARESEIDYIRREIVKRYGFRKVKKIVRGGLERQDSVYNGLLAVADRSEIVLSHDGARPFVDRETVERALKAAAETDAAVVGVPVKDTIKSVADGEITETPERSKLWQAQTPQCFSTELLKHAYEEAIQTGFKATDDSALVEQLGKEVRMVRGSYENIKITTPDDVILGEALMLYRMSEAGRRMVFEITEGGQ